MTNADRARLDRVACRDVRRGLATEWLETDGVGGFASSTVFGCPTRRYHGLLVAMLPGSVTRHLFLSAFDASIRDADGRDVDLAPRVHAGRLQPERRAELDSFELAPHPTTQLRVGDVVLRHEVVMLRGRAAVMSRYRVESAPGAVVLRCAPTFACRPADALHFRNDTHDPTVVVGASDLTVRPYASLPPVVVRFGVEPAAQHTGHRPSARFEHDSRWRMAIEYRTDVARGYGGTEDLWSPGAVVAELRPGDALVLAASLETPIDDPIAGFTATVAARRRAASAAHPDPVRGRLAARADDFLYRRDGRLGVIAGFPWFGEWGRDTFLALPGLTLARGQHDLCADALAGALPFLRDGLLPNIYGPTPATSHYGSIDAALWFARAVDLWRRAGGDRKRYVAEFVPALRTIATAYHDGTALGIRARPDGLLTAGGPELNATWMDAQTAAGPVTPRDGMPVEIEALWVGLLDQLAETEGGKGSWRARASRAGQRFVELFWLADRGHLADRIDATDRPDPRIRPNMVLAAALPRSPLTAAMRRGVLEVTERELLTPRGLRTLAPSDPDYQGVYRGDQDRRDHAYHQGTVWPWLLGSYVDLALAVRGASACADLRHLLDGFAAELDRAGLDHVSEVFDGDPPHEPGGTIAQAWSTAELLRAHHRLDEASP